MSAHTPGPWVVEKRSGEEPGVFQELPPGADPETLESVCIATVHARHIGLRREANARLIAAAPDLLKALESLCAYLEDIGQAGSIAFARSPIGSARYDAARAAISKARGA